MIRRPPRSPRTDTLFPYPTLFRSAARIAFLVEQLLAGRHRDDLVVEAAGLLRRRGALLALQRVLVLLRTRDAVAFGDQLGRLDHRDVRGRLLREHRLGDEAIAVLVLVLHQRDRFQAARDDDVLLAGDDRSEEHTSELQSLMRISY